MMLANPLRSNKQALTKKALTIAAALTLTFSALKPSNAHAFFLVAIPTAVVTDNAFRLSLPSMNRGQMFVCAILLPFCILDEKVPTSVGISRQELLDNGYTSEEVDRIQFENQALSRALMQRNQRLVITPTDTQESVTRAIRAIMPRASTLFLDFAVNQNLVNHSVN